MATVAETASGRKKKLIGRAETMTREEYEALAREERLALIRKLIPIGLMAVGEELQREVDELVSGSVATSGGTPAVRRYGSNPGSIVLGNQRVPIRVPRLRGEDGEVGLESYEILHRNDDSPTLYKSILQGVSCRDYESTIEDQNGAISKSKSTVSRRFVKMGDEQLKKVHERDLSGYDIVALFIDGTPFAEDQMVIALGVTLQGAKVILGFTQTGTENGHAIGQFLTSLLDRGLSVEQGILAVTDGAKGLLSALRKSFRKRIVIQRCQWHKRENVVSHLAKRDQDDIRGRLRLAYGRPNLEEVTKHMERLLSDLDGSNQSAAASLREGMDETLTLHRLGVYALLGRSLKTTNCLESVNASAEKYCGKIDYWKNSAQKQRWLACALMEIEPTLNRIAGRDHLPKLRAAIKQELKL